MARSASRFFLRWVFPIGPDWVPTLAKPFDIGVAVLGNDGLNPFGMLQRHAQANRGAIIEDVDREFMKADGLGEFADDVGQI